MPSPLSTHSPDQVIAYRRGERIGAGQFYREALALAEQLPRCQYVINTCQDRYLFMVGFAAAAVARKPTLMPSSFAPHTLSQLQQRYPDLICLHDGRDRALGLPAVPIPIHAAKDTDWAEVPLLDADQLAAIVFTSGSTGEPTAHPKRWGRLCVNGAAESERLHARGVAIVATVPAQHMYGFESSILLALHGGASLWHGKPFYPVDICQALESVPRPRMLVTTPFHLQTLLDAGLPLPACDTVLSATAPLADGLARRAEAAFNAPLLEIYGCTESGQVASRRPVQDSAWQLLPGVGMSADEQGAWVHGGHVEGRVMLSDHIEATADDRFLLKGRHADMVNIAGKRTSLAYLNTVLASVPGVADGCFLPPDEADAPHSADTVQRLAALVVAPTLKASDVMTQLRARVDPVFLPRPLLLVDALPRNATGKLVRADLIAFFRAYKQATAAD